MCIKEIFIKSLLKCSHALMKKRKRKKKWSHASLGMEKHALLDFLDSLNCGELGLYGGYLVLKVFVLTLFSWCLLCTICVNRVPLFVRDCLIYPLFAY